MGETKFPSSFFPTKMQEIITEVSRVYKFNEEFLSAAVLSTCATAFGNTFSIRVKSSWIERPSLFIAIVGTPGINKSAPLSWALKPIEEREKVIYKEYKAQIAEFQSVESNNGKNPPPLLKTIISDATPEAVVQQLHKNERGIMIYYDELAGFLNTFQRYNKGNDEQFYLSVWSGKPVIVDRKTMVSIRINEPVLNIIGTIQPSVLEKSFTGKEDSGFFDRWLIVHPKNAKKEYWTDDDLDHRIQDYYSWMVNRLLDLNFKYGAEGYESFITTYTKSAYKQISIWQKENTDIINKTDNEAEKAIRSKMETYVHRFALIHSMLLYASGEYSGVPDFVDEKSAFEACNLTDYFVENALSARYGDPADKLPEAWKELYSILPPAGSDFKLEHCIETAAMMDISESSVKRWIKKNEGVLFTKIKHGLYAKN